jgi:type II secretion system protein H
MHLRAGIAPPTGFTLIDLVVVVLIMGITTAVVVPRYAEFVSELRVKAAAQRLAADLRLARHEAVVRSQDIDVVLSAHAPHVTIAGLPHLGNPAADYTTDLSGYPYYSTLLMNTSATPGTMGFNMHGLPTRGGELTLESGGRRQTVLVNKETGEVTVP